MDIINVKNLNYNIDDFHICKDISVQIAKNNFTGIIGPNGSGKSTFLKQIYRVLKPTNGAIYLEGENIEKISHKETAKKMGVLAQESHTDFDFLVYEVVLMGRAAYHSMFQKETPEDIRIMKETLEMVGMTHKIKQRFRTLSGGEKQRVLLARALAQKTNLLILDEPTNHLDIGYQFQMMELLDKLPMTILAAIHDLNLASRFCDKIILINEGKIIKYGKPEQVLTRDILRDVFHVETVIKTNEITKKPSIFFTGTYFS